MAKTNVIALRPNQRQRVRAAGPTRPTAAQREYLERGLRQAGGKLPLFDRDGQRYNERTIRSCIAQGWSEPWHANAIKPDWLVCRLTDAGRSLFASD